MSVDAKPFQHVEPAQGNFSAKADKDNAWHNAYTQRPLPLTETTPFDDIESMKSEGHDIIALFQEWHALDQKTRLSIEEILEADLRNDGSFISIQALSNLSQFQLTDEDNPALKALISERFTQIAEDPGFEERILGLIENNNPQRATDLVVMISNQTDIDIQETAQKALDAMKESFSPANVLEAQLLAQYTPYELKSGMADADNDNTETLEMTPTDAASPSGKLRQIANLIDRYDSIAAADLLLKINPEDLPENLHDRFLELSETLASDLNKLGTEEAKSRFYGIHNRINEIDSLSQQQDVAPEAKLNIPEPQPFVPKAA